MHVIDIDIQVVRFCIVYERSLIIQFEIENFIIIYPINKCHDHSTYVEMQGEPIHFRLMMTNLLLQLVPWFCIFPCTMHTCMAFFTELL